MSDFSAANRSAQRTAQTPVRILIVDDHELLRDGLKELLSQHDSWIVCGEASSEEDAMETVHSARPDLVLVDVTLEQGNGINLIKRIHDHDASIRTIVCSMYDEKLYAERALRAGASGYVHKQAPARSVLEAIHQVLAGGVYLSPTMAHRLSRVPANDTQLEVFEVEHLAERELEVFTLVGQGLMTAQIADQLKLSPRTVDTYRERIKAKLNLRTAAELNRRAVVWVLERE